MGNIDGNDGARAGEIAVQQRLGPQGWSETLDRMIKYGAPIPPADKDALMAYLLRHDRDPDGR